MLFLRSAAPHPITGPSPWPGRARRIAGHGGAHVQVPAGQAVPPGADGWSATAGSPSLTAFDLPFFAAEAQRLRLRLAPPPGGAIRLETILPSRMQKAKLVLDAAGTVLDLGDEIREARTEPLPGGGFLLEAVFEPWNTRPDFLLLHHEAPGGAPLRWRGLEWESFALDALVPSRGHPGASEEAGTFFATRCWAVFRDALHLEFEVLRPGAPLTGLALESPLPLDHASWFTSGAVAEGPAPPEGPGMHPLTPRTPRIPLASPALMDMLGPEWGTSGNVVRAVLAEPVQMPFLSVAESDQVTAVRLHASFADGARTIITPQRSMEQIGLWTRIHEHYIRLALAEGGPGQVFLELGARGPTSAALRATLDPAWRYLGTDIEADANVDLVADAHRLSEALPHGSVGFCHSNSVMEHLLSPERVVTEVSALLRPGGIFFAFVPGSWPLHAEPWDYQRYTIHKWPALLNTATGFEILERFEAIEHMLVPSMPFLPGVTRNQHARAPAFTGVVARKVGPVRAGWAGWAPGLADGRYDP